MFANNKVILQLTALLKAHGVEKMVLCPGSRNAPLVQTFCSSGLFECHSVTDERSAAYFALGQSLNGGKPVAVCCTSGTAVLNMHPAIAEAYYQQVPLVVVSADRPAAWIGQMDGQTVPQARLFGPLVKAEVSLPAIHTEEDEWYCNRLINEALLETCHHGKGPVHINVPLSEPLFDYSAEAIPEVRVIQRYQGLNLYDKDYSGLIDRLNKLRRRIAIAGQMSMIYLFERKYAKMLYKQFAWFSEHLGNRTVPGLPLKNFDTLLYRMSEEEKEKMRPDLVITYGGHVVSKRLKQYLRSYPPREHWHISADGKVTDLFGCLTTVIEMDPFEFMEKVAPMMDNQTPDYPRQWENLCKETVLPPFGYSSMAAVQLLTEKLPVGCCLHSANSSAVRYLQLFPIPQDTEYCCNRGTNGIEGSLSTALGYASANKKLNFIVIGDLSFFYDMNILGERVVGNNVRILLLNNGGGEIFHTVGGLKMDEQSKPFITASHGREARKWVEDQFEYIPVRNSDELEKAMEKFTDPLPGSRPMFIELFVDAESDARELKRVFHEIKV